MIKDDRYEVVKTMIETGKITEFAQIFKYIPKSKIAEDLRANYNRIDKLEDNPEKLTLEDIYLLGAYIEMEDEIIEKLASSQVKKDPNWLEIIMKRKRII